jgi:tripartite-type tricarboxylate transporter receptor subunit TctC
VKLSILCLTICSASLALALDSASRVAAAEDVSFAGKVITMTIGFAAGSGTDLYGRTIGQHLLRHLPGNPRLIVVNQPGAGGVVALNDWTKRAEPNGQFLTIGQQSQVDPDSLIRANAKYDPRSFHFLGGVASASQGLFVNKAAVGRLTAGSAEPVTMGIVGSTLRGGNYQALWGAAFLGWNVKWVRGYPATGEVLQALDREEIDMSSFSALKDANFLRQSGKFTVVCQGGAWVDGKQAKSAWIGDAPFIGELLERKLKEDPQARQAFDYWQNLTQIGIWLALPPNTPDDIRAAYGKAYQATIQDRAFLDDYSKINPDALYVRGADLSSLVSKVVSVPPETLHYIDALLQRQGFVAAQ